MPCKAGLGHPTIPAEALAADSRVGSQGRKSCLTPTGSLTPGERRPHAPGRRVLWLDHSMSVEEGWHTLRMGSGKTRLGGGGVCRGYLGVVSSSGFLVQRKT